MELLEASSSCTFFLATVDGLVLVGEEIKEELLPLLVVAAFNTGTLLFLTRSEALTKGEAVAALVDAVPILVAHAGTLTGSEALTKPLVDGSIPEATVKESIYSDCAFVDWFTSLAC